MASAGDFHDLSRNFSLANNGSNNSLSLVGKTCNQSGPDSSAVITIKTVILCTIMLAALAGNAAIIIVFMKTKTLRKTVNFFIVNMAIADSIAAAIAIPNYMVPIVTRSYEWRIPGNVGLVLCKCVMIVIDASSVVSVLSMVCLAVDRFCAVVLPMNRNLITSTTRKGLIIATWVLALAYSSPYVYTMRISSVKGSSYCIQDWGPAFEHFKAMNVQLAVMVSLLGVLPWVLVATLYAIMVVEINKSKHASHPNRHSISRQKDEIDTRVVKLSLAIVLAFAVCYFPLCSMYFVVAVAWNWDVCTVPTFWSNLWFIAVAFMFLYQVLNPCVCFTFSENFQKGLKKIFAFKNASLTKKLSTATDSNRFRSKTSYIDNQNPSSVELSESAPLSPRVEQI